MASSSSSSFERAVYCISQGDLLESHKHFEVALRETRAEQHHVIHCNVGSALLALQDLPSALAAFEEALQLKHDHLESLVNAGIANMRLLRYPAALEYYSRACELSPKFHPALCGKCEALANLGRFKEAIAVAQTACELIPDNPFGFADIGFAQLKSGDFA